MTMKITYKPVNDLIPYARNSRTHSEAQIAQIAGSIKEFGFRSPVLVDGENGIIAGHGRVLAAMKIGMDKVPTIDGSDMTPTQRKAYVIADNKIALNAGWVKRHKIPPFTARYPHSHLHLPYIFARGFA